MLTYVCEVDDGDLAAREQGLLLRGRHVAGCWALCRVLDALRRRPDNVPLLITRLPQ